MSLLSKHNKRAREKTIPTSTMWSVIVGGLIICMIGRGIVNLENSKAIAEFVEYESQGWLRESVAWDGDNQRFLVSFMEGGIGEIGIGAGKPAKEETLVKDMDYAGNATLGFRIDRPRNRLVVAIADVLRNKYSAVAAYDMKTWNRIYLTHLTRPGDDEKSLANDVAVDKEGNAYVTDAKRNKIWKVGADGSQVSVLSSPVFTSFPEKLPLRLRGLNGIVYHPDGFLLCIHSWAGMLFKASLDGRHVSAVNMSSFLIAGNGLKLLSPDRLVVAGIPSARLIESRDGWRSAQLTHRYVGPMHRIATAAAVKDGKVFLSHMLGLGFAKRKHLITQAVFVSADLPARPQL